MSLLGRCNNLSAGMASALGLKPIPWGDTERRALGSGESAWKSEAFIGVYTLGVHPEERLVNQRTRRFEFSGRYYWFAEDGGECCFVAGGHEHVFDSMAEAKMAAEEWFREELRQYLPYVATDEEDHRV